MTGDANNSGWYWVYPSPNNNSGENAIYPMSLTVNYSTFLTELRVNGHIITKDLLVTLNGWPDYVFEDNYKRMSILEKEAFYKKRNIYRM
jgi:hypothetical protein